MTQIPGPFARQSAEILSQRNFAESSPRKNERARTTTSRRSIAILKPPFSSSQSSVLEMQKLGNGSAKWRPGCSQNNFPFSPVQLGEDKRCFFWRFVHRPLATHHKPLYIYIYILPPPFLGFYLILKVIRKYLGQLDR